VIGTATSEVGAQSIGEVFSQAGLSGRGAVLDVCDATACEQLVDSIQQESGAVAILVNNAGITRDNLAMRMKMKSGAQSLTPTSVRCSASAAW
jgi:3-oxoacyl-[acyl-carrier protein] reductase